MKLLLNQIIRDENNNDKIITRELDSKDIAALYKDRTGNYVTTKEGKFYKVDHNISAIEKVLGL